MLAQRHVVNIDDIDQLGELRVELRDRRIRAGDDERHARYPRIVGRCYVQCFDVVAARRKHARHTRQCADFVLQKD